MIVVVSCLHGFYVIALIYNNHNSNDECRTILYYIKEYTLVIISIDATFIFTGKKIQPNVFLVKTNM